MTPEQQEGIENVTTEFHRDFGSPSEALSYWQKSLSNVEEKIIPLLKKRAEILEKIKFLETKNESQKP